MKITKDQMAKIICECHDVCVNRKVGHTGNCGDCLCAAGVIFDLLEDTNPDPDDLDLTQTGRDLFAVLVDQS